MPIEACGPLHGLARDGDAALVAVEQSADDVEQRGLAAAGRADHREEFARRDVERDVIDRGEHAFRRLEPLDDVVDDEQRRGGRRARAQRVWSRRATAITAFLSRVRDIAARHGGRVARLDAHIDDRDPAAVRPPRWPSANVGSSSADVVDRPEAERALRARQRRDVDVGIADALADPLVLDRPVAHARDALLVHFVVVERAIVGDHDAAAECGNAPPSRARLRPSGNRRRRRSRPHAAGALQRERRADRDARAAADAAAAVGAEEVERMAERPPRAVPRQRQMRERARSCSPTASRSARARCSTVERAVGRASALRRRRATTSAARRRRRARRAAAARRASGSAARNRSTGARP